MGAAAELVGVSQMTVRRWIEAHEPDAEHPQRVPVARRERDEHGRGVPGSWRRPYADAVEEWHRRRAGRRTPNDGPPTPAA